MMANKEIENISVVGVGSIRPGEHWHRSLEDMASEAAFEAVADADISLGEIDTIYIGNMLAGMLGSQANLGSVMADCLGLDVPAFCTEGGCASGGLAFGAAVKDVLSGESRAALILGTEKMTDWPIPAVTKAIMSTASEPEQFAGLTLPGLFATLTRIHMREYGTTQNQLAAMSVNSHHNAIFNPKAQFRREISLEQVRRSPLVAGPLRVLECSPISDGAAALIVTTSDNHRTQRSIRVAASAVATDTPGLGQRKKLTELKATREAAQRAYEQAGVEPGDIDLVELDDCFSISHILAAEDLGFFKKGEAARVIASGETQLGSEGGLVINPSGGLKAGGNPVGAVGVYQIVEVIKQLRGEAGDRQVPKARIGLAHDLSGTGVTAVVHILKR